MAEFDENDLVHKDYENKTTTGDDPEYTGTKDRVRVNKKERYEVIDFCNEFMKTHDLKNKSSFQKIEEIIRLPEASNIVMRDKLNEFVTQNWKK
ncbi:hypothetical protein [Flavobacterium marginilacus]|uniref:hypothetical protein n=1 Tax=Flavobacterium marginilacus TaxID=3003256 RepID=UPI00248DC924|nr:hypothetical protein [Flavobacterium marginilacus]